MSRRPLGDHWLQEYSHFREMGFSDAGIAERLGITEDGLARRFARMNNRPALTTVPDPIEYPSMKDRDTLAEQSVEDAAEAICRIRDENPGALWVDLACMTRDRLLALTFALAAMVPDDRTVGELLAWTEPLAVAS